MKRRLPVAVVALIAGTLLAAGRGLHGREGSPIPKAGDVPVVQRFLSSAGPQVTSYRALRTLEAAARGGKMRGKLEAWTSLDPEQGFQYSVVSEDGSELIRSKVLKAALEAERTMARRGDAHRGALTPTNYDFTPLETPGSDLVQIAIHPRRVDTLLLEGRLFLTETSDLVRIEGVMVKRPSFWTRRVDVTREYARINGVRVPVGMSSVARVLVVGTSTFSMSYHYETINGEAVAR